MLANILITAQEAFSKNIPCFIANNDYTRAISAVGALPIAPLNALYPEDYLFADGLLLTGGPDIHCGRYGEVYQDPTEVFKLSLSREAFEFELCRLFLEAKKPIFGIGRGMQLINVALGGTLCRDVPGHQGTNHNVTVMQEARLFSYLQNEETVNSFHHQAIKTLGEGLVIAAVAGETIEAIEHRNLPVFGVQWHPELPEQDLRLFSYFGQLCMEGKQ